MLSQVDIPALKGPNSNVDALYIKLNEITEPSLIRVESDEVRIACLWRLSAALPVCRLPSALSLSMLLRSLNGTHAAPAVAQCLADCMLPRADVPIMPIS